MIKWSVLMTPIAVVTVDAALICKLSIRQRSSAADSADAIVSAARRPSTV